MPTNGLLLFTLTAWVLGALVGWLGGRRSAGLAASHALAAVGALGAGCVGWVAIWQGPVRYEWALAGSFGPYILAIDGLAGLFLLALGLVGAAAATYGIGYTAAWRGRGRSRMLGALLNVFLLAMAAVLTAGDAYTFLLAWEVMSVSSFFLVVTEFEQQAVRRAGLVYLIMTHLATALIILACLIWYAGGPGTARGLGFDALAAAGPALSPWLRSVLFWLLVSGFATKAGAVPLHIWLPRAHPVAPSHVSALMSGVMVKIGLYGILRFAIDLLGPGPAWWGGLLLLMGALSALGGALYANQESDLKRLLAFSTVENVGIMLLSLGTAELALNAGQGAMAALALSALLYHLLGHAAYKGLLFLGAGAVLHATGQRSLDRLGGLIRGMPVTAFLFFIGAMAIAGLPPLAGFASEWLTISSLAGLTAPGFATWAQWLAPLLIALVGTVAALVAATLVKAFGIGFLGMARTAAARHPHEADGFMQVGMAALAVAAIGLGLAPRPMLALIGPAVQGLVSGAGPTVALPTAPGLAPAVAPGADGLPSLLPGLAPVEASWLGLQTPTGSYAPVVLALVLVAGLGLGFLITRLLGPRTPVRRSPVWASGVTFTPVNQYTAGSFAKPLRLMLRTVLRPQREVQVVVGSALFPRRIRYRGQIRLWLEPETYRQVLRFLVRFSRTVRGLQTGSLHRYLTYMFVALVLMLLVAR